MWKRRKISLPPSDNQCNPAFRTLPVLEAHYFFLAPHGLQGFLAPHGLQGFLAPQGLQGFLALHGLQGFLAPQGFLPAQGLQAFFAPHAAMAAGAIAVDAITMIAAAETSSLNRAYPVNADTHYM